MCDNERPVKLIHARRQLGTPLAGLIRFLPEFVEPDDLLQHVAQRASYFLSGILDHTMLHSPTLML